MVQVHCEEEIANRIGAEPCVVGREAGGEASGGAHIGQPLSRERINRDADAVVMSGRRNGGARDRERVSGPAWSKTEEFRTSNTGSRKQRVLTGAS